MPTWSQSAVVHPLSLPQYRLFWLARLLSTLGATMTVIVIGWQVYDTARQTMPLREAAFVLGLVGLAQFLPLLVLNPFTGVAADRLDRRHVARAATALELACVAALGVGTATGALGLPGIFALAALREVGRAFAGPALSALAPNLVPAPMLPRAVAMNSIAWQSGAVLGPLAGGALFALAHGGPVPAGPATAYAGAAIAAVLTLALLLALEPVARPAATRASPLAQMRDGLRYVRANRLVLGSISLDLFAVILGGATALLPVYARDILHVGPAGLGGLRAAPALGAALVALALATVPIGGRVGLKLFLAVGAFGVATIVFGLSRSMPLSLAALFCVGATDMISVYVRNSLVQIHTPDAMRGRVSAVSGLFISASNELGEFESGLAAAALGPVGAVVAGGAGAVLIAAAWWRAFPELARADTLAAPAPAA